MTHSLPRTHFNASPLVRSLSRHSLLEVAESNQSIAERLGLWLDVSDAIALFAVLNPGAPRAAAGSDAAAADASALREELARLKKGMTQAIAAGDTAALGAQALIRAPAAADAAAAASAAFAPYRRYYLVHQRDMAARVGGLRVRAREALAARSPAHKRLAELDAVLDQGLGEREREALGSVAVLLEKRFDALLATQTMTDAERWLDADGWLTRFGKDVQDTLLMELEVRLQPVVGLIEAHSNE